MSHDPEIIFAVRRLPDGSLWVDWHSDLYPVLDENGKDTDRVIDLAEEFLAAANEEAAQSAE
jgi:hypothetical protein